MHPNPLFRPDAAALLAEAERIGFAHIFAATADGPMVVHAPVTLHDDGLRFHVSRANRIVRHLEGAAVVASVAGPHGYVSANWYAVPGDQVPTWNYQTIEIDGGGVTVCNVGLDGVHVGGNARDVDLEAEVGMTQRRHRHACSRVPNDTSTRNPARAQPHVCVCACVSMS